MINLKLSKTFSLLLLSIYFQFAYADLITDVCTKAQNHAFCEQTLRSDPRAPKANLKGLAKITIALSKASAQSGIGLVTSLLNQADNPKSKEKLKSCLENYKDAVYSLNALPSFLKKSDYLGLAVYASSALTDPDTCDDGFKEAEEEDFRKEPPQLVDQSKRLQDLIDIILVVSSLLRGSWGTVS